MVGQHGCLPEITGLYSAYNWSPQSTTTWLSSTDKCLMVSTIQVLGFAHNPVVSGVQQGWCWRYKALSWRHYRIVFGGQPGRHFRYKMVVFQVQPGWGLLPAGCLATSTGLGSEGNWVGIGKEHTPCLLLSHACCQWRPSDRLSNLFCPLHLLTKAQ